MSGATARACASASSNPDVWPSMKALSSAPVSARWTRSPQNRAVSVPGAMARNRSASSPVCGSARIDHDDARAARPAIVLHAPEQDGVAPGRIRADQHEEIGLVEVFVAARHGVGAESAAVTGDGRGHAQARIGVDVARAEEALHELVGDVVILRQELAREIEGDRIRAVLRDDAGEAVAPRPSARRPTTRAALRSSGGGAGARARASRRAPSLSSKADRNSTGWSGSPAIETPPSPSGVARTPQPTPQ